MHAIMYTHLSVNGLPDIWRRLLQRTGGRVVLKERPGFIKYEVNQYLGWRLLMLHGEFRTRLRVTEDRNKMCGKFELIDSDVMQFFEGTWKLQPCTQRGLDRLYGKAVPFNPFASLQGVANPLTPTLFSIAGYAYNHTLSSHDSCF